MKSNLTYERAHEVLEYNHVTGLFYWKVSPNRNIKVGDVAGGRQNEYITINVDHVSYKAHRLAWLMYYGYFPEHRLDHRDRIGHHNWISNLREVSQYCNMQNCKVRHDSKSGVPGVTVHSSKKWEVAIQVNGKRYYLGLYENLDDAVKARWDGEVKYGFLNCNTTSSAYLYLQNLKFEESFEEWILIAC